MTDLDAAILRYDVLAQALHGQRRTHGLGIAGWYALAAYRSVEGIIG